MKPIIHELLSENNVRDAIVGLSGTTLAVSLQGWQSLAAIFAATSTGIWMLTQAFIAIKTRLDNRKK